MVLLTAQSLSHLKILLSSTESYSLKLPTDWLRILSKLAPHTHSCHPYRPLKQVQLMLSRSRNPFVLADMYLLQSPEGSTRPRRWVVSGYLSYTLANRNRRDLLHWDPAYLRNGSHSLSVLDRWKRSSGGRLHEAIFNVDQNSFVSM